MLLKTPRTCSNKVLINGNYVHLGIERALLDESFTDRDDKNYLANIDRLVAVTDSELFENVVTSVYQRKEYTFKKKSIERRRRYRIPRLASLKCTASELSARIQALNLPDDIAVYGLYIPYPIFGPEDDEEFDSKNDDVNTDRKTQSESRTRSPSPIGGQEPVPRDLESLGVRFTRKVNRSIDEESSPEEDESLYVKKIKPHSIAERSLCVGDRILAINGIMLDQQSLDQIAGSLMESGQTDLPAPNLNHLATEILKAWLNGTPPLSPEPPLASTSACEPQGRPIRGSHRRRPPLHLTIARSNSHRNRISPRRRCPYHASHSHKPQWNVLWSATIPADPTEAANISVLNTAVPAHLHVHNVRHVQEPEEDLVEVELIDFVKSECGIGAFLRPSSKGVGAKVEKIAEGELAAIDGRLRVNDRILYINDVCVCMMRFKDILRVYRAVADRARTTDDIQRGINFRPIRLVVSRPATGADLQPTEASLQKLVVPRKSMLHAARDLARLAECPRVSASAVPIPAPTTLVADTAPVATAATADPLRSVPAPLSPTAAAAASVDDTAAPLAASCSPTSAELPRTVPPSTTPPPPPSEPPASLSSPLILIEETVDVKRDFPKAESPDSPLVGAVAEDVGVTFWEPDSAPDTPTARAMASDLIDDIMGEFQACPGKSVDLLRTDGAEDPLIEDLPLTPFQRADLRRFWRSTFRENVSVIVADYHLPPSNHSFGLTVETVIEEDEKANVREYRHYLLEVDEDGPVGTQTDLRPRDELLEINGVILYGKDSETVKTTLTSASANGYIVCARPQVGGPFAEITPFSVIEEEDEEEEEDATQDVSSPISHFDGTDEIFDANLAKLSSTALSSQTPTPTGETPEHDAAVPDQPARTPSPLVVLDVNTKEVPDGPKPATATDLSAAVSVPVDEQAGAASPSPEQPASPVKDELPEVYDDELSLVITKRKAELLGIQLGPPVGQSWGFPITEITPGGPVARLINSPRSGVWPPDVQVGDEVVEVNGRRLKGLRMFSVRSILWDLVPFEGEVSLKYRQTSLPERAVPTSGVDGPPIIIDSPQIKSLDQNIFMRMQAAGNSGIQSSAASNSRNHTRRGSSGKSSVSTEHNPTTRK
ncbi:hypothetical protein SprV_0301294600 [Sparganum proliferum]